MNPEFLAGIVFAWVIAYTAFGVSFCLAYSVRRREPEYLVFGLHALSLALFAATISISYTRPGGFIGAPAYLSKLSATGALLATALLLHFSLLFAHVRKTWTYMRVVYGIGFVLQIVNAAGGIFRFDPAFATPSALTETAFTAAGSTPILPPFTPLGTATACLLSAGMLVSVGLIARACAAGRREGMIALAGATVLATSVLHDLLLGLRVISGTWASPHGSAVFTFGIAGALLVRSSLLSNELELNTRELERRSEQLKRSYQELREAQRELSKRDQLAAVGELAAVVAHEVRNPLTIIGNAVSQLRRGELANADREKLLAILTEESSRLNHLVNDLLRYARPINAQRQLISIQDVLARTIAAAQFKEPVSIEIAHQPNVPPIWGDANLLRQVFENLVENAIQAMGRKGTVRVRVDRADCDGRDGITVAVEDSGAGMDSLVRSRAKDPFFTTRPSGTGLGLAIVDRIVEAHDGDLSITSRPGQGTTVLVYLPIGKMSPPAIQARGGARATPEGGSRRARPAV